MDMLAGAVDLYRRGNAREAEAACEALLSISKDNAEALILLAEIQMSTGRIATAIPTLISIARLCPRDAANQRRLGGALLAEERPAEAVAVLRGAIDIEPDNIRAHNNLGQALMRVGEVNDAIRSYEQALRIDPRYAIGHNNLGLALTTRGDLDQAANSFRIAIALDPGLVTAHLNLAIVFETQDRLAEALEGYDHALAISAGQFDAWVGRGGVLTKLNRIEPALESFDRALALRPEDAMTLTRRAAVMLSLNRTDDALKSADHALRARENSAEAHDIKGSALRMLNRPEEALQCSDRALELNPEFVEGWCNRAVAFQDMGDHESAASCYRRALQLDPDCLRARTQLLASLIPSVPLSEEESNLARTTFDAELAELEAWLSGEDLTAADALTAAQQQFFYLSYQEESNRNLLERYRSASAQKLSTLSLANPGPAPNDRAAESAASSTRFKLGFVSAQVFDHSVFKAILEGWLKSLDRARFDITLFYVGVKHDTWTLAARDSVEHFEAGARTLPEWIRTIKGRKLEALIFPEIGMNQITLALASMRLADRQFAAWGHPETSGLSTIDYYLSAELFEPPNGQDHYTERLVRLPNLGVHYQPYGIAATPVDFAKIGIRGDAPLFVCPGVPFKYRPQDDQVLVEIARRLGRCEFVFFQHDKAGLSRKLQARMSAAFRRAHLDAAEYLVFIPWQPRAAFLGLLRQADVYLDTIGFSGFNTLMQGIEAHLPCVTYEGRFMRGRLGSAILQRLGIPELVASTTAEYIQKSVDLAEDSGYRSRLRDHILSSEHRLYADTVAVDALSQLLLQSKAS